MLTIKNNEEVYSAPECMVISVKVQGMLCQSGPGSANNGFDSNHDLGGLGDEDDD